MKIMDAAIAPLELEATTRGLSAAHARRRPPAAGLRRRIPRSFPAPIRRLPDAVDAGAPPLEPWRPVVVYCVRGHEVSQDAAAALRTRGLDARYLAGGIERWRAEGNATRRSRAPTRWVTRARPKIDRIACPWLIRRFIDRRRNSSTCPNAEVRAFAAANGATAYDIPGRRLFARRTNAASTRSSGSTGSAIRRSTRSRNRPRRRHLDARSSPQAPGLLAASLGLSAMFADDHAMLKWGMLVYDSLYAWCREAQDGTHGWYPEKCAQRPGAAA